VFAVGASLIGTGSGLQTKSSWTGSFFSGFLATIVATPCTAPFMGVALGFALVQPVFISILVFTMIALGMATPFFLLTCFPALMKKVPRPGPWMESLKQFMGFLMMATMVWLIWVLSHRVGSDVLIPLLSVLLLMGFGAWIAGRWGTMVRRAPVRWIARTLALACVSYGLFTGCSTAQKLSKLPSGRSAIAREDGMWQPFSPEKVEEFRKAGKPVFVNFTATWCLTCQVNKKFLQAKDIEKKFKELDVVTMIADWTDKDPVISKTLASMQREGVPFYVLYPAGLDSEPIKLPELLTKTIILNSLEKL